MSSPHHVLQHPVFLQRIHRFAANTLSSPQILQSVCSSWYDTQLNHHGAEWCWQNLALVAIQNHQLVEPTDDDTWQGFDYVHTRYQLSGVITPYTISRVIFNFVLSGTHRNSDNPHKDLGSHTIESISKAVTTEVMMMRTELAGKFVLPYFCLSNVCTNGNFSLETIKHVVSYMQCCSRVHDTSKKNNNSTLIRAETFYYACHRNSLEIVTYLLETAVAFARSNPDTGTTSMNNNNSNTDEHDDKTNKDNNDEQKLDDDALFTGHSSYENPLWVEATFAACWSSDPNIIEFLLNRLEAMKGRQFVCDLFKHKDATNGDTILQYSEHHSGPKSKEITAILRRKVLELPGLGEDYLKRHASEMNRRRLHVVMSLAILCVVPSFVIMMNVNDLLKWFAEIAQLFGLNNESLFNCTDYVSGRKAILSS